MPFPVQDDVKEPLLLLVTFMPGVQDPLRPGLLVRDVYDPLAKFFNLTDAERRQRMEDDRSHWENTVQWARAKLVEEGMLEQRDRSRPARWRPTVAGVERAKRLADGFSGSPRAEHLGVRSQVALDSFGEERIPPEAFEEGHARQILVNSFERNPQARAACISHYGKVCSVCGFDFERTFGSLGAGFIHVHHLRPLKDIGSAYIVDPVRDLRPLCANCHAIVHRRDPPYSLEELEEAIDSAMKR